MLGDDYKVTQTDLKEFKNAIKNEETWTKYLTNKKPSWEKTKIMFRYMSYKEIGLIDINEFIKSNNFYMEKLGSIVADLNVHMKDYTYGRRQTILNWNNGYNEWYNFTKILSWDFVKNVLYITKRFEDYNNAYKDMKENIKITNEMAQAYFGT